MKETLENDLNMLKSGIDNIRKDRAEVLKIEKKMMSIENITNASQEKFKSILLEKKNIENISDILNELKEVSENVEGKVEQIKSTKLLINNVEDKIAGLQDKFVQVENFYTELQDKEDKVRNSIETIDNIHSMSDELNKKFESIKKNYDDLDFKRTTFEKSFKDFEKEANIITKSEKKIADVMDKFKQMDILIEDLEMRTNTINNYRAWLVKAETQIVNLNQDTEKKIKLLESLLADTRESSVIKNKIGDETSKKETVIKLKKQGWTIDEISKTLNLSAGEVEFILDLEHNTPIKTAKR
jgi:DNA repair exonuclease SbcCD ATPase subunit